MIRPIQCRIACASSRPADRACNAVEYRGRHDRIGGKRGSYTTADAIYLSQTAHSQPVLERARAGRNQDFRLDAPDTRDGAFSDKLEGARGLYLTDEGMSLSFRSL